MLMRATATIAATANRLKVKCGVVLLTRRRGTHLLSRLSIEIPLHFFRAVTTVVATAELYWPKERNLNQPNNLYLFCSKDDVKFSGPTNIISQTLARVGQAVLSRLLTLTLTSRIYLGPAWLGTKNT